MYKKAGTPLAIGILTFGIVALLFFAWFTFLTKENSRQILVKTNRVLDVAYSQEAQINFYISQMVNNAAKEMTSNSKEEFIEKFQEQLIIYSLEELIPELKTIPPQLDTSRVSINENTVTLTLKFNIKRIAKIENLEAVSIEYIYEKEFSANFDLDKIQLI